MDALSQVCEIVAATNSRLRKVRALSAYLAGLDDADLVRAVRFLCGAPVDGPLSVGGSALREALVEASGWPLDLVRLCSREVGDTGETVGHLMTRVSQQQPLSLGVAEEIFLRLAMAKRTALKHSILVETFLRYRPLALRYFVKAISGNLRIGLQEKLVEETLARAMGVPLDALRAANNKLGRLWDVALAARRGTLDQIEATLFHPMEFMLAKPLESVPPLELAQGWWVEDKYDGIRAQAHIRAGQVRIFSRGMEEVTGAFPELVAALSAIPGSAVIDGEVLAWRVTEAGEERALPFTLLQQRLARKKVPEELRAKVPLIFMGYDLIYRDGQLLVDTPLEQRRALLQAMPLRVSPQQPLRNLEELEALFTAARGRGNEGLLLKRSGSLYEAGRRGEAWLKVKRPYGTLDVVVTAAEQGHGRRATVLSDYTFAVRDGDRFLNVGKAYSGLTDEEIRAVDAVVRRSTIEKFGPVRSLVPSLVFELGFEGISR
ncbi:MAG: hypothetical protein NTV70_11945, partial [Acidobacteria bacterium]|nr:hypothetical protein [Acidobacteriota bacterium]